MARRLVEAGARCVTLNFGRWEFHSNNFSEFKNTHGPLFDQGMSALVEDLHERGMDKDVSVVAWGEFGRTPMINKDAGRDHWPQVGCGLLAGGGMRHGQVIGATDRLGGTTIRGPCISAKCWRRSITNWASTRTRHAARSGWPAAISGRPTSAHARTHLKRLRVAMARCCIRFYLQPWTCWRRLSRPGLARRLSNLAQRADAATFAAANSRGCG